jgi:site-specific DNA-methyltransferase (adenine-specific)
MKLRDPASFDLIMTSPPYSDQRRATYGGLAPEHYVQWFLPRSAEMFRVLKWRGSFVLNIKERVVRGERSTYVLELILALRKQGWIWTEEYIWHKKNCNPGKWPNRFRDAWERCLHFTKSRNFYMNQEAVMKPAGEWNAIRRANPSKSDGVRNLSKTGSGFGRNVSKCVLREHVYPSNVLHIAPETRNRGHSAVFPKALPEFFIKLFCPPEGFVLDPFSGSGTTMDVAESLGCNSEGIDLL